MIKPDDPRKLAEDLLDRSICAVQVAAVIADRHGIFSWGINHVGFDGLGQHAEAEAIRRGNVRRLRGSTIYIAARRARTICAQPCARCFRMLMGYGIRHHIWSEKNGQWSEMLYGEAYKW